MPNHSDGSVIDANLGMIASGSEFSRKDGMVSLYLGQIVAVYPIDDQGNRSHSQVEYDILVMEASLNVVTYRNCTKAQNFGSINDFEETVLTASPDPAKALRGSFTIGAWVIIGCIGGSYQRAKILMGIQHPGWNLDITAAKVPKFQGAGSAKRDDDMQALPTLLPGAKIADGKRSLGEFNGLRWNIENSGAFTVMFQGKKKADGTLFGDTGPTILKFAANGDLIIMDKLDQQIVISPGDKKITITDAVGNGVTVDSGSNKIQVMSQAGSGVIVDTSSGQIKIGSDASAEPLVLGQTFSDFLTTILQGFNVGFQTLATASSGPLAPLKPGFVALGAVCIQAIAQLPTILSKKVFTELGP